MSKSRVDWAVQLDLQCHVLGLPAPVPEFVFHESRKWRLDRAWPPQRVAVEIEGGVFLPMKGKAAGRHSQPAGFRNDCVKYAEAAVRGWRVLRVLPEHVKSGQAVAWLQLLLEPESSVAKVIRGA